MSLNTANTPDGRGVLIYNGEMILLFIKEVNLIFDDTQRTDFKGKKQGNLYLTSHRIIFVNTTDSKSAFRSFAMPFQSIRNVKLEQPIFGANYLTGTAVAQPDGNWNGEVNWRLTFNKGGCIEFGQAFLKANQMANNFRPTNAPPPYAPTAGAYYAPAPAYYMAQGGNYNGFQAPIHAFPDQPPEGNVFVYEQPPPYAGIGPNQAPHRFDGQQPAGGGPPNLYPSAGNGPAPYPSANGPPPNYDQATALPTKSKTD